MEAKGSRNASAEHKAETAPAQLLAQVNYRSGVLSIECEIEFKYESGQCISPQNFLGRAPIADLRSVGTHWTSYSKLIRSAMRSGHGNPVSAILDSERSPDGAERNP